ncbi:MAG: MgtC/SapB family protein [Eubacteriales bacterium]
MNFQELLKTVWESETVKLSVDAFVKLSLAAVFSGIIGYEREHSHRPAGFRTHILVAVGSALVMLTSTYIFAVYKGQTNMDPARLGAQVISGIGFLGAGTILREGFSVKGLTTAASLWAVSCIGLSVGVGYYEGAFIATVFIFITLNILKRFIVKGNKGNTVNIKVNELSSGSKRIGELIHDCGGSFQSMEIIYPEKNDGVVKSDNESVILKVFIITENDHIFKGIIENIRTLEGVEDLYVE